MPWFEFLDFKRRYTISEIADELGVPTSTIRHWESVCPKLAPYGWKTQKPGSSKARKYRPKDRERLHNFHNLVKVEGYTLKGAARKIQHHG